VLLILGRCPGGTENLTENLTELAKEGEEGEERAWQSSYLREGREGEEGEKRAW
jgi:hypothetical protein